MNRLSFLDELQYFWDTRTLSDYLIFLAIALFFLIILFIKIFIHFRHKKALREQQKNIHTILERAQIQNENFDLQLGDRLNKNNYSSLLIEVNESSLVFNSLVHIPQDLLNNPAEFFFAVRTKGKKEFYKFRVKVLEVKYHKTITTLTVAKPKSLDIGQKRAFFRITPLPNTVKLLAIWLLDLDKPLPKTTSEVGTPLLSCTWHRENQAEDINTLSVADISGSGIALHIPYDPDVSPRIVKDAQILCLLVYNESFNETEHLVNFCCTGHITNVRGDRNNKYDKIVGMEFTNWAILESSNSNITWFHQAKATGIGPILQWVTRMVIEMRKNSPLNPNFFLERNL
ncbi:MAG: hypothetical protein IJU40_08910 [Desulfovibrionaceae bacterium]|nr:hypothetical protein [Desulfovibrionaceae bacterium]